MKYLVALVAVCGLALAATPSKACGGYGASLNFQTYGGVSQLSTAYAVPLQFSAPTYGTCGATAQLSVPSYGVGGSALFLRPSRQFGLNYGYGGGAGALFVPQRQVIVPRRGFSLNFFR